jgi:hypothetical protein
MDKLDEEVFLVEDFDKMIEFVVRLSVWAGPLKVCQ